MFIVRISGAQAMSMNLVVKNGKDLLSKLSGVRRDMRALEKGPITQSAVYKEVTSLIVSTYNKDIKDKELPEEQPLWEDDVLAKYMISFAGWMVTSTCIWNNNKNDFLEWLVFCYSYHVVGFNVIKLWTT